MTADTRPRPGRTGIIAIYLFAASEVIRIVTADEAQARLPLYVGALLIYLIMFTAVLWRPHLPLPLARAYMTIQSAIIVGLIVLDPQLSHVNVFFLPLAYQVAFVFTGNRRWIWVGIFAVDTALPLMLSFGVIEGLALGLTAIAGIIVVPACVIVNQEIERARAESAALLAELQATHARLEAYANQVDELAAVEERNRLARELHDSVSQTMFGITLTTRTVQVLLERNPTQVKPQLEKLQALTQSALAQMRSLIAELRPQND